ncbi:helix-turn-helix domain-containing protein [Acidovorax sp. HMWF029]|uniref:helix-turn-helix domain-containing protein n=1 Tax=Acidovorax sp. HMWF029 TaxID=2056863 RepID=UPI001E3145D5|nr:helix-turn-helix domain-containing protein [Acidovorax sp. HMWF029]
MSESWFELLQQRTEGQQRTQVAKTLGISPATLSQVLNGSGEYGKGTASTARVADKVVHTFGRYVCPHLTEEAGGVSQEVTADQCRAHAHRSAPSTPRDMRHWQACNQCPHKAASAPPVARAVQPRSKVIPIHSTPVPQEAP